MDVGPNWVGDPAVPCTEQQYLSVAAQLQDRSFTPDSPVGQVLLARYGCVVTSSTIPKRSPYVGVARAFALGVNLLAPVVVLVVLWRVLGWGRHEEPAHGEAGAVSPFVVAGAAWLIVTVGAAIGFVATWQGVGLK